MKEVVEYVLAPLLGLYVIGSTVYIYVSYIYESIKK